jgi:hypothetical protein
VADRKISDLTALTTPATGDLLPIVDVSEAAAADKNKSITIQELFKGVPDGTAAAPGLAFESDDGNGIYKPGTDQVAISTGGTGRLFVAADGAVGVGTTSPAERLHVYHPTGNVNAVIESGDANAYLSFKDSTTSSTAHVYLGAAGNDMQFATGTAEKMRIDSSGRVGIGTSSPTHLLSLQGSSTTLGSASTLVSIGNTSFGINTYRLIGFGYNSGTEPPAFIGYQETNASSNTYGDLVFGTRSVNTNTVPTERMRIDSSGRVGVGTTSPSHPLTIQSDFSNSFAIQANSDTTLKLMLGYSYTNDYARIASEDAGVNQKDIFQHALNHRWGRNNSTEYMRLDSSGRVGIGTSSPSYPLDVVGDGGINSTAATNSQYGQISIQGRNSAGSTSAIGRIKSYPSGSGNTSRLAFETRNSSATLVEAMRIDDSQRVGIGTTSPGSKLDVRGNSTGDAKIRLDENGSFQGALQLRGNDLEIRGSSGTIEFYRGNNNEASSTEIARFDTSGRLLVGTTSGTESVHVNGAIASVGTSSSFSSGAKRAFFDYNGGANRARIGVTSGANNAAQAISFHTSPSGAAAGSFERFRIGEVGQLGIGGATYGTSGQVLTSNGSSSAPSWQDAGSGSAPSFASICDEKTAGTYGGNSVSATWTTRDLNTELSDPDGIVSISSNQFTLGAGTYTLIVTAPFYRTEETLLRVKNVTDTTYYRATTGYHRNATYVETVMTMAVTFTISASKAFAVQYRCGSETFGLGVTAPSSWGTSIYTKVDIIKYA